jgi:hypothetical protein
MSTDHFSLLFSFLLSVLNHNNNNNNNDKTTKDILFRNWVTIKIARNDALIILIITTGNAAEHVTAIKVAMANKMGLAISVVIGRKTNQIHSLVPLVFFIFSITMTRYICCLICYVKVHQLKLRFLSFLFL